MFFLYFVLLPDFRRYKIKHTTMIRVKNEGEKVTITTSLNIGWDVSFSNTRSHELDAVLLRDKIRENLRAKIESIRREAYNEGWKDAKSKNCAKQTWFSGNIE